MSYHAEPPLTLKSPSVLHRRFRLRFGVPAAPDEPPSRRYRLMVKSVLRQRFGTPTPPGLMSLIDEAGRIGVHPDDIADFIGGQFKLVPLRRASKG